MAAQNTAINQNQTTTEKSKEPPIKINEENIGLHVLTPLIIANELLENHPSLYYTNEFAEWFRKTTKDIYNKRYAAYWNMHMYRINAKDIIQNLKRKAIEIMIEILKHYGINNFELIWADNEPELKFTLDNKNVSVRISKNRDKMLKYVIFIFAEHTGIYVDLINRKVALNKDNPGFDTIEYAFSINNMAELYLVLDKLKQRYAGEKTINDAMYDLSKELDLSYITDN